MEHFNNYFKNEQEVRDFFEKEVFVFSFMSGNTAFFETLNPRIIDGTLYSFQLAFYYESQDFFKYSSFNSYLDRMQLSSVEIICESYRERETMYFRKYVDPKNN